MVDDFFIGVSGRVHCDGSLIELLCIIIDGPPCLEVTTSSMLR